MQFNKIFTAYYSCWDDLEAEIERIETAKEKGTAFEQFAYAYFLYFKDLYQIKELYMGPNIPDEYKSRYKLEKRDSGVDGLIITEDGSSIAYQVKFRRKQDSPSYDDLTSFWAESEHTSERCIIANCYQLPKQAHKKKNQFTILRDSLSRLDKDFFSWLHSFANAGLDVHHQHKYSPFPHQRKIILEVLRGFQNSKRGKLLAACGTGKTLTSLWIKEELYCHSVLFVAPNLALIKQTLESWMSQTKLPFSYLCVCSDNTVASTASLDEFDTDISYIDIPVTTDVEKIQNFIHSNVPKDKVIFSTYQSLDTILVALKSCKDFSFDIAFFDEAHRTAGNKDSKMFVLGMHDEFIPCKKRLFMTATERFVNPRIIGRAKQLNYEVFSMDKEEQYGTTFSTLSFRDAIEKNIISDYKIVLCCMKERDLLKMIQDNEIIHLGDRQIDAQTLFKQVLLGKTMNDIGIHKVISYHRNIHAAKEFIEPSSGAGTPIREVISDISDTIERSDVFTSHINGTMPAGTRKEIFDAFIQAPYGIISNVRCLTEGVDVPIIDAVYFAEPKNSIIDIIQAVGRSLRIDKKRPEKISYIIIPMVISDNISKFEEIDPKEFNTLHAVIQALREQDRILADYIDKLNLRLARGKGHITQDPDSPIIVELSKDLSIDDFSENLSLRIAEVNKDPSNIAKEFIVNKTSRVSGVKRTFRTVGDYNIDSYYSNLVLPTLKKYESFSIGLPRESITINHNNVSHCVKIGVLSERDMKFYVTDIGKAIYEYPELYISIFQEQMLKYYELDTITRIPKFPYRMAFRVISKLGAITRFEFAYSLYIMKHFGTQGELEAIQRVLYLRNTYPNIEMLNESNKRIVLDALNAKFDTTLSFEDIWTSRTTVYNQYNYIKKHLLTWDKIFSSQNDTITLLPDGRKSIDELLDKSSEIETCPLDSLKTLYTQYKGY